MYYVTKRLEIAGCHRLELNYESQCSRMHGHNWIITVHCRAEELNENGILFSKDLHEFISSQGDVREEAEE